MSAMSRAQLELQAAVSPGEFARIELADLKPWNPTKGNRHERL
jgi:hypothetical protein